MTPTDMAHQVGAVGAGGDHLHLDGEGHTKQENCDKIPHTNIF